MAKIKLTDVKTALLDPRFRQSLPESARPHVEKFLANPGCACNHPIYRFILTHFAGQLRAYFPGLEYEPSQDEEARVARNHWSVINCAASDLEERLRALPPGRKQLAMARSGDQITVIVNELEITFVP